MKMSVPSKWYRNSECKAVEEELLVFGYSCKIFRDDEKATYIDQGKHLIPWMGDETLMIDRYDVRGYLHDLKPYEADGKNDYKEELTEEERLCEEERYLALSTDLTEQELYHEEELKRLKAAVASDGAYHEIGFSYDSIEDPNEKIEEQAPLKEEPEDEPYSPPEGLKVPKGMHTPSNMKIHTIIEKTAMFVSQQGGQMEIIIKMKQSNNPQFAFMQFDNPLHPYYKHLVQEIKSGHYKPVHEKKVSESDDEHHDDHYLHPSLSGASENIPKFTVPSINFRRTGDDSYSLLVKNLKDRIELDAQRNSPVPQEEQKSGGKAKSKHSLLNRRESVVKKESSGTSTDSDDSLTSDSDDEEITPPPPDVKPVIDKMAEYVAKNGIDFETIVKGKNDKRFSFLKPGNKFYNYYMYKKNMVTKNILAASNAALKKQKNARISQNVPSPTNILPNESATSFPTVSNQLLSERDAIAAAATSSSLPSGVIVNSAQEHLTQVTSEPDITASSNLPPPPEPPKLKSPVKPVPKGPICFSLKSKEPEVPLLEKPKKPALLLDDSEDEDGDGNKTAATNTTPSEKSQPAPVVLPVMPSKIIPNASTENEEKAKRLSNEEIEAKLAEEKMKDKLAAAVRERLAQQKRDKQLQLERKQRAALFLKMLQKKPTNPSPETAQPIQFSECLDEERPKSVTGSPEFKNGSYSSPVFSEKSSPKDIIASAMVGEPSPAASIQEQWSSSSESEEPAKMKEEEQSQCNDKESQKLRPSLESPADVKKRKKSPSSRSSKSHKSSKKHKRSRSRSPSHRHKSSKSKSKKEKKLPAAYAIVHRSRSRSPVRYSSSGRSRSPSHFNFNRWR